MVKTACKGIMKGLHKVLVKGLLGSIQEVLTLAHMKFATEDGARWMCLAVQRPKPQQRCSLPPKASRSP